MPVFGLRFSKPFVTAISATTVFSLRTTRCLLISNTLETISRLIWPRWPLTQKRKSGGPSWIPCRNQFLLVPLENGGLRCRRFFTQTEPVIEEGELFTAERSKAATKNQTAKTRRRPPRRRKHAGTNNAKRTSPLSKKRGVTNLHHRGRREEPLV